MDINWRRAVCWQNLKKRPIRWIGQSVQQRVPIKRILWSFLDWDNFYDFFLEHFCQRRKINKVVNELQSFKYLNKQFEKSIIGEHSRESSITLFMTLGKKEEIWKDMSVKINSEFLYIAMRRKTECGRVLHIREVRLINKSLYWARTFLEARVLLKTFKGRMQLAISLEHWS